MYFSLTKNGRIILRALDYALLSKITEKTDRESMKLVLASSNAGKLRELSSLLQPLDIHVLSQEALGITAAEEPFPSFVENALVKARHAARLSGLPALADDSGLCVRALAGAPGVHSARYAGIPASDVANNEKLIAALSGQLDRQACYICVLVFLRHADDPMPLIAQGTWYGEMIDVPRGTHGFGYDPYFWLPDLACTAAELTLDKKNAISHRAQAMADLLQKLRTNMMNLFSSTPLANRL